MSANCWFIPGQNRTSRALRLHLSMPRWLLWIRRSITLLSAFGTIRLSFLSSRSSQTIISSLTFQYSLILWSSGSIWDLLSGHPFNTVVLSFCKVRSFLVSSLNCSSFSPLTGKFSMMITSNSSFQLATVSLFPSGARLRVSGMYKFLPGSSHSAEASTSLVAIFVVLEIMVFWTMTPGICGRFQLLLSCRKHTGETKCIHTRLPVTLFRFVHNFFRQSSKIAVHNTPVDPPGLHTPQVHRWCVYWHCRGLVDIIILECRIAC